ncbi:MAG: PhzF family phenazine biosynthesis protein [Chloroflexi bacterium]|nr:PhzF family phenazine biosynthesis protein [Chloroflexota bacterium]
MKISFFHIDAFADQAFAGNPAAVCLLTQPADATWMQQVAAEMNLPATAFLSPQAHGFQLRWFTAQTELEFCGHGTLASAHALWAAKKLAMDETANFYTRGGHLTATQADGWIQLNFPATPAEPAEPPAGLLEALAVEAVYVGKSKFDYLVEVATEALVRALQPDLTLLRRVPTRGVIVTSRSATADYDFVSRFFAPATGIPEDPVTGSAHCCLTPYWSNRLGKTTLVAYQASQRGGLLRLRQADDRVYLSGRAVTVLAGELFA